MPWVENLYGRGVDDNRDNVPLAINGFASGEGLKSTMKTMRINNIDNEDKASDAESCFDFMLTLSVGYSWDIRRVFREYSWSIRMYRVCVGNVSGMYRESNGR